MHPLFEIVRLAIETDINSMIDEGHDAPTLLGELAQVAQKRSLDALLAFQQELWARPLSPSLPYDEPSDWEAISKTFPPEDSHARFSGDEAQLADRVHGGWLGRVIGCQLGKPMECAWPDECKKALQACDSWPLLDYMNPISDPQRLAQLKEESPHGRRLHRWQWLAKGQFSCGVVDDDTTYSMVGLRVLEKYGTEFTTDQYIAELAALAPRSQLYSSGLNMFVRGLWGMKAPYTAIFGNPCRQSLGAMIRCDPFGWAAPANPASAARMAFQDARGSQTRNGIYGGIFFAVLLADAFAHGDVARAIQTARQYMPPRSRFAEMVDFTVRLCAEEADWEQANAQIYQRYHHGLKRSEAVIWNHILPNAAITLMSLLYGDGDFGRTIGIATMAGMDTDCTAATAGSIMGVSEGAKAIPRHWQEPLHDALCSQLVDLHVVKISDMASRTCAIAKRNCRYAS